MLSRQAIEEFQTLYRQKFGRELSLQEEPDREQIIDSHNKCLNQCIKKIESLFNMRVNGGISVEEYSKKKRRIDSGKRKIRRVDR